MPASRASVASMTMPWSRLGRSGHSAYCESWVVSHSPSAAYHSRRCTGSSERTRPADGPRTDNAIGTARHPSHLPRRGTHRWDAPYGHPRETLDDIVQAHRSSSWDEFRAAMEATWDNFTVAHATARGTHNPNMIGDMPNAQDAAVASPTPFLCERRPPPTSKAFAALDTPGPPQRASPRLARQGATAAAALSRLRGGLLSSLGGFVIRIRILMYRDVSCVYHEGYMYPSCILMYLKCILNALLHSKRIHVS
jgi:hypothetical protein